MRLIQFLDGAGKRCVGARESSTAPIRQVNNAHSTRELALEAARNNLRLVDTVRMHGLRDEIDDTELVRERRLLLPVDHPDSSHVVHAVTGLTHWGSASAREAMHAKLQGPDASDSMKMFKLGLDGGKPPPGEMGVQPEWAYKGDGGWAVAPEHVLEIPSYAEDAGDEAEVVGLYVIGNSGEVLRLGFALGNEYSDHVMEQRNYLYLAHSKLRQCSYGPELLLGDLPADVRGTVSIRRDGGVVWAAEFLSGEDNMTHSIQNLEHHHFKYPGFRRPGDVHVYFFGASVLSYADKLRLEAGDQMEIASSVFGLPLRNKLANADRTAPVVRCL